MGSNEIYEEGGQRTRDDVAEDRDYLSSASLLVVGAEQSIAGLDAEEAVRIVGHVPMVAAAAMVREMVRLDVLWLVAKDVQDEDQLAEILYAAAVHDAELICETSLDTLDRIIRLVPASMAVQWLVEPDATERRVALAAARPVRRISVHDPSRDATMERIDRLQEEVARISRLLGRLAGETPSLRGFGDFEIFGQEEGAGLRNVQSVPRSFRAMARPITPDMGSDARSKAKSVRGFIRQRRAREQYFPAELFADPAWDMLLDLYAARLEQQAVSVSSLCIAAAVPATTALRWIKTLSDAGLFMREADARDGRRIFIAMSDQAYAAMEKYFTAMTDDLPWR